MEIQVKRVFPAREERQRQEAEQRRKQRRNPERPRLAPEPPPSDSTTLPEGGVLLKTVV